MKRILAFLLVLVMLMGACLLTGCSDKDDNKKEGASENADDKGGKGDEGDKGSEDDKGGDETVDLYTLVNDAIEKTLDATSYEANVTLAMDSNILGMESSLDGDLVIKMNGDKISVVGPTSVNSYGQTEETEMNYFFDGDYVYMQMYGEGYKMSCTAEEFATEYGTATEQIKALPEALFDGVEGDGSNVVLTLDEATAEELFGSMIIELCYDIVGEDLNQVTTKDTKVTLSVKNGYIDSYKVEFTCAMGFGDNTATYIYAQESSFVSIGSEVTVTGPDGYEDYYIVDGY